MRTILNIDIALLGSPPAPVVERAPPLPQPGLFQLGAPAGARSEWSRWSLSLVIAAGVHALLLGSALALRPAAPSAAPQDAPELVFLAYAPPPPPPGGSGLAVARPAPRPVQARSAPRPVVPKKVAPAVRPPEPEPVAPEPEVAPQEVPVPALASVSAAAAAGAGGSAPGGMAGGVAGGVAGGHVGGVAGAPVLQLKQVARLPQLIEQVRPHYPRSARAQGIVGVVLVRAILGVDGRVEATTLQVLRSIPELDDAAVEAVRRWRFSPAIGREGRPVRVMFDVPVQFSLR